MPNSNSKILDRLTSKNIIYIIIIGFLSISLCIYDLRWIIPSIFIYIATIIYTMWVSGKKKTEIENHIKAVTSDVDTASKGNLINTPIPLVLIETNGNIIWRSKKFVTEFQNIDIGTYLNPIVKEIKLDIEKNDEPVEISKQFNIDKKIYRIRGSIVKAKKRDKKKQKEYILSLYFINETKYNELFDQYNNSKPCIGIAMIDNYEDIIQRILPEKKIELLAKIEKEIIDWVTSTGGLIIKTERDTFIYVFEQQYLAEFEKEKFNILDRVKNLDIDEKIQITLSIAISTEGNSNYEKYKLALAAMEIVLGRGGDQAVVRKDGKYKFYGGKTLEVEKRTKVKARIVAHALEELIAECENVIIMGHMNPDIDAMGSALGIYRLATSLRKDAYILTNNESASIKSFIENIQEEYKHVLIDKDEALSKINNETLLVVVDTHKKTYVEEPELLTKTNKVVVIDHHRRGADFIEQSILTFQEVYASSASELVAELIQYTQNEIELSTSEAEALYAGIMMDTKNFTFKTGVRTFEAAAYLRRCGVDIIKVKKWFQSDLESYNKISEIVRKSEITHNTIAISSYESQEKDANLICAKAADELLTIGNITASFVLGTMGEKICISGRSIGDINVQMILEKLGGGGHITLAGAQLENKTIEEAKQELIEKIEEYFNEKE